MNIYEFLQEREDLTLTGTDWEEHMREVVYEFNRTFQAHAIPALVLQNYILWKADE